ncbi:MAG: hypothetical protein VYB52_00980 [Candidatus Neomarinimicrobiota bacterium]|nr:hypothetical protein [Candidatus Neomarinimicrobiota bacterium]MED5433401.1 hypothetical protein [Candidatus Neomarinimicrobiota bacterium]
MITVSTLMVNQLNKILAIVIFLNLSNSQQLDSLQQNSSSSKPLEAKIVTISARLSVGNYSPSAYRFTLFPRNRPSEVFISRMFFPNDTIQVVLPENVLSPDTLGNIASFQPIGGAYETIYRLFSKSSGTIDLGSFKILPKTDIIKLNIIDGIDFSPVPHALVSILQSGAIISSTIMDSMGYARLRIPVDRHKEDPINILIETEGRYPSWQGSIEVTEGISSKTIQLYRLNIIDGEALYSVVNDLTPFRKGPENGSEILFFLNRGDQIVINKVAGNRLFGRVRIDLYERQSSNFFQGWILSKNVKLLNEAAVEEIDTKNE